MLHTQPDGHLAFPPSGKKPIAPVLVLHPWWGLNQTMKDFCDRLANEGFIVFAPDLYHGKLATTIPEAEKLVGTVEANASQVKREIREAALFLRERAGSKTHDGIAVIGFSMGAYFAFDLSIAEPELVHSVIVFYGSSPEGSESFSRARAKYLLHFAEHDPYEPRESITHLKSAITSAGRPAIFHLYEGARHWFMEPDRPEYNAEAAELAWRRTLEFLREE